MKPGTAAMRNRRTTAPCGGRSISGTGIANGVEVSKIVDKLPNA
jgi:hypothetical protein